MGNYASYQHNAAPAEESQAVSQAPLVRENTGVTSVTVSGEGMASHHSGVISVSSDDLSPYSQDDWRSTAVKPTGHRATKIDADTRVTIGGMQASVQNFISAGVLQENPDGTFSMMSESDPSKTGSVSQTNPQSQPQDSPSDDTASMPVEMAQAVDAALEPFSDYVLENTMHLAIAASAGEMDMESVIRKAAMSTGLEPKDAGQRVQFVMNAYQAQAMNYLIKQGLSQEDMGDFYGFATKQKGDFKNAINRQVFSNDLSGYKALVNSYLNASAPSVAALEANGFTVKGDQVRIQGTWMNIKQAAKSGFI